MIVSDFQGGGGVEFPAVVEAGDAPIAFKAYPEYAFTNNIPSSRIDIPGRSFTMHKAGAYRFTYTLHNKESSGNMSFYMVVDDAIVTGSNVSVGAYQHILKVVDVVCVAGSVIKHQVSTTGSYKNVGKSVCAVSILADDIQAVIDEILTPTE